MRVLITGGAGFVGSQLASAFRQRHPSAEIVVLDNLRRRGSELNLPLLKEQGIQFVHGDIRNPSDLEDLPGAEYDLFIEASAEPSVQAGLNGSPHYVLQTNLGGTLNCLDLARKRAKAFVFLSTSRVYSILPLREINLAEKATRFEILETQQAPGITPTGVSETFPTHLARSFYGATKLASELVIQEYVQAYGLKAVINRCGVIAGPGQFGKSDQGVFTHWVANHHFRKSLTYTGFGGQGKQVRDLLHPADLFALIEKQFQQIASCSGQIYNVGGGTEISTSLNELTTLCQQIVGNSVPIHNNQDSTSVDIPLYISDYSKAAHDFNWKPQRSVKTIVQDIAQWINLNEKQLTPLFA